MGITYEMVTQVYGMHFYKRDFTIGDVRFQYLPDFWKDYTEIKFGPLDTIEEPESWGKRMIEQAEWEKEHHATGTVTVTFADFEGKLREAVDRTKSLLFDYSILLSFAHRHHVPFGTMLDCYEGTGPGRRWCSTAGFFGRFGKPGIDPHNVAPQGIEAFLRHSLPRLTDVKFDNNTRVRRGMTWYNEVECIGAPAFENWFPSLWTALEILAGAHATSTNCAELASSNRLSEIRRKFKKLLFTLQLPSEEIEAWTDKLNKHTSAMSRANRLLESCHLTGFKPLLPDLYKTRNKLVHGQFVTITQKNVQELLVLGRIVEILIFKILGFNQKDLIRQKTIDSKLPHFSWSD